MRQVLNLYHEAWKAGVKTVYYVPKQLPRKKECEASPPRWRIGLEI